MGWEGLDGPDILKGNGTCTAEANCCAFSFSLHGAFLEPVERTHGTRLPHFLGTSSRGKRAFSSDSAAAVRDKANHVITSKHTPKYSAWNGSNGSCENLSNPFISSGDGCPTIPCSCRIDSPAATEFLSCASSTASLLVLSSEACVRPCKRQSMSETTVSRADL
jgi:hypothetical protein